MNAKETNRAIWQAKVSKSKLMRTLRTLHRIAQATARCDYEEPQILCGPSGVGKTHVCVTAFTEHKRPYRLIKSATALGLAEEFDRCARTGEVALLDDADAIWRDPVLLEVLMAATSPKKEGPRTYRHVTKTSVDTYSFDSLVVVIVTNTTVLDFERFGPRTRPKIEALVNRCFVVNIASSRDEVFYYTCWLAICCDMLRLSGYSRDETNDAMAFFACNRHLMSNLSPRTLLKIAERRRALPGVWREAMAMTFDFEDERPYTGEIPRIVVEPKTAKSMAHRCAEDQSQKLARKPTVSDVIALHQEGRSVEEIVATFSDPGLVYGILETNGLSSIR